MGITLSQRSHEGPLKHSWCYHEQCWCLVEVTLAVNLMAMERMVESRG